ncbi:alanine racemase [Paenibacillus beijingensis]|uniref:Alanine racemase n=1 Tax=Paenibacillus beijingensis TaxID=1126833 RepID=A0A0D5NNS7_9BACL|nr:alanine racemase [Paenibacillus beijingensis]AJY76810.1 alanine racemase [Paenibacillus beijingensis]
MIKSEYSFIDTPALLIDEKIMLENLRFMQEKANQYNVNLRPHTKTHRMPELAKLQLKLGASGITVAKVGEAEVMAENGIKDIFIANEIVGISKLERIKDLNREIKIRIGVDSEYQIDQLETVFKDEEKPIEVLIEIEVGENRSGVITDDQIIHLSKYIQTKNKVVLKGVFSHEGHTYKAKNVEECIHLSLESQERTLRAGQIVRDLGIDIDTISIGATPALMHSKILEGITEIRTGTYIFMDVGQGSAIQDYSRCAATVLATVISKPTEERVVLDAGAKALTSQNRTEGICSTHGFGLIKGSDNVRLSGVFDEHGLIYDKGFRRMIEIGDKVEVIPNHICPTCNLYEKAYLVSNGTILEEIPVLGRGKSQ